VGVNTRGAHFLTEGLDSDTLLAKVQGTQEGQDMGWNTMEEKFDGPKSTLLYNSLADFGHLQRVWVMRPGVNRDWSRLPSGHVDKTRGNFLERQMTMILRSSGPRPPSEGGKGLEMNSGGWVLSRCLAEALGCTMGELVQVTYNCGQGLFQGGSTLRQYKVVHQ
jgi:hypothetical protein